MTYLESDALPDEERPRGGRRRTDVRRIRGPKRWISLGIAIALVVGFLGISLFTQTRWGRGQILAFTLATLGGRLNGQLSIERLDGNLLTGARLYRLNLSDHEGTPLAEVDSAYIRYRPATLAGGDMVITRLDIWNAHINLLRMPGDTVWNYQEILTHPDPDPTDPAVAGATLVERLHLHDSRITVRMPIEPDARLSPERQQLAIEEILADTARWMIEAVPGGHLRAVLIDVERADLAELFVGPDERGGIYAEINQAAANIRLWRDPPLELRDARAQLHLRDGIVNFEAQHFALPDSRGTGVGRINLREDRPMYDVSLTLPAFALADLRWLYPWLPEDPAGGRGTVRVWIEDRPDDTVVIAHELILDMPRTRITGRFGLVAAEILRFVDVDIEADPVDLDSVEQLFPEGLPVEGLEIGGATIRGVG